MHREGETMIGDSGVQRVKCRCPDKLHGSRKWRMRQQGIMNACLLAPT